MVNQIAAGEVVERASSALKELIENAIDASATRVQVVIKGHGMELIQVIDDGSGMDRDDLHLAFERHATSKLSTADDLHRISSFGFRGEALPSIASVSFVEAQSCTGNGSPGTMLRLDSGEIILDQPIAMSRGTIISVHSLYYNTPARAAFAKSPATELAHLVRVFRNYAIAFPEIHWSFTHGTSIEFVLPPASFETRLNELFGSGFAAKTQPLTFNIADLVISGVVGKQELNKRSRGDQYIFLNRRPIQSPLIHSAFKAALAEFLEPGEWPFYVLLMEMDPSQADVNCHPSKLEVKFRDEKLVHAAVYRAVRSVLPEQLREHRLQLNGGDFGIHGQLSGSAPDLPYTPQRNANSLTDAQWAVPLFAAAVDTPVIADSGQPVRPHPVADQPFRPAILQMHSKYLIAQIRSGIALIDQHAAHERVLYERALRSFEDRMFNAQQLLFPMLLELDSAEDSVFQEVLADLGTLGFQIHELGPRTYSIDAVPAGLRRVSEAGMIHAMLSEYSEFRRSKFAPRDALAAGFACKAAIRTGDLLSPDEMSTLIDELFATRFPNTCPHGRPTVIHLTLTELDRRFKRSD